MGTTTNTQRGVVVTSVRVPPTLFKQLRDIAEREDRSVSAEMRRAVAEHVKRDGTPREP